MEVSEAKYKAFVYAIRNHYWYQMYIGEGFCVDFSDTVGMYTLTLSLSSPLLVPTSPGTANR